MQLDPKNAVGAGATTAVVTCTLVAILVGGQPAHAAWERVPIPALGRISASLGHADNQYHVRGRANRAWASNRHQGFAVRFRAQGAVVQLSTGESLSLKLARWGQGGHWEEAGPATALRFERNRLEASYESARVVEWYENGPLGLEHGFTIGEPFGVDSLALRSQPLILGIRIEAVNLQAQATAGEVTFANARAEPVVRYGKFAAWDRAGRSLPVQSQLAEGELQIWVDDRDEDYPIVVDPLIQSVKATASDGSAGDFFGVTVAISSDTLVVGAPNKDLASNADQGQAYVFVAPGGAWSNLTQVAVLRASDGVAGDRFGASVAMAGDRIVIGAPRHDGGRGAAYVFVRPAGGWSGVLNQNAKLLASDGLANDTFGTAVAVAVQNGSNDVVVVGAPLDDAGAATDRGAVYVFERASWAGTVTQTAKLTPGDGAGGGYQLGTAVDVTLLLDDCTVVAGAQFAPGAAGVATGAAYVFVKPSGGWVDASHTAKLTPSDGAANDNFGAAVAVRMDTALVGSPSGPGNTVDSGAAYLFVRNPATGWQDLARGRSLYASDGANGRGFGRAVALSEDRLLAVVGQPFNDPAAYVFRLESVSSFLITEQQKLVPSDPASLSDFGYAVHVSGWVSIPETLSVAVGAPRRLASTPGAAYLFREFVPTATATRTSTPTPSRTRTPTRTLSRTPTLTVTPSPNPSLTRTPVPPSETPLPTETALPSATDTPLPTSTELPSATYTQTPSSSPTPTATTPPLPTATWTFSPSASPTVSASVTATHPPTPTPTPSATRSQTASPPVPASATPTVTPSHTASATMTKTATSTATPSATGTTTPRTSAGRGCGNGVLESGESCDDGNTQDGDCCNARCEPEASGHPCEGDANPCTVEQCDGAGECRESGPAAPGTACEDDLTCTLDQCDGAGNCVHEPVAPEECPSGYAVLQQGGGQLSGTKLGRGALVGGPVCSGGATLERSARLLADLIAMGSITLKQNAWVQGSCVTDGALVSLLGSQPGRCNDGGDDSGVNELLLWCTVAQRKAVERAQRLGSLPGALALGNVHLRHDTWVQLPDHEGLVVVDADSLELGPGARLTLRATPRTQAVVLRVHGSLRLGRGAGLVLSGFAPGPSGSPAERVLWWVSGEARLGRRARVEGTILARDSILLLDSASVEGGLVSTGGTVELRKLARVHSAPWLLW